jgi:hypothetical protein
LLKSAKKRFVHWMMDEILFAWFASKNKRMILNQLHNIWKLYKDRYVLKRIVIILSYVYSEPYRKTLKNIFK